jgi:hypothetical protein
MAVDIEFSSELAQATGPNAERIEQRMEDRINRGLERLGRDNPAAQALYDSNQTIRIVCKHEQDAIDRRLDGDPAILGGHAETLGDFDADGNPVPGGTVWIAIECGLFETRGWFDELPVLDVSPFDIILHELLHATHRDRVHSNDDLSLYEEWVNAMRRAIRRRRNQKRAQRKVSRRPT